MDEHQDIWGSRDGLGDRPCSTRVRRWPPQIGLSVICVQKVPLRKVGEINALRHGYGVISLI